jgi:REP element-mobilizing transposase RayT
MKPKAQHSQVSHSDAALGDAALKFFNPFEPIDISHGNLPHWEQTNATYFITWRTADSIPQDVLKQWHLDRQHWLLVHGIEASSDDLHWQIECLPDDDRRAYHRLFTQRWHGFLDSCHGACVLRQPECAQHVADALLHFDGDRCLMQGFVVMPNHVHVLTTINGRGHMKELCKSWKRFSAAAINRSLGRKGEFWQTESFDHIVRNQRSMDRFREYIRENPLNAKLRSGEYILWERPRKQHSHDHLQPAEPSKRVTE